METSPPRISDNPSSQDLLNNVQGAEALKSLVDLIGRFGIKSPELDKLFEKVPELSEKTKELIQIPDRFNSHFAARGWIAHESLNNDLARSAIQLADAGKYDEAETALVDHYDDAVLRFLVQRCNVSDAFRPRWELAQAAKNDYLEGRYHAAVPVILILIDGFVNDVEQTGFFAENTDLTAWDSIAAHSSGLSKLAEIFCASRKKTTTEPLTVA